MPATFLPMSVEEVQALGWDRPDFCLVCGDAYVDHPSFGPAIIGRTLERHGYKVAVIAQPDWRTLDDFKRFGRPRLGFLVSPGNIDSMVCHYTASKKPRHDDAYTPGGRAGKRPDRPAIVYTNKIRQSFRRMPIVIGGLEASLRRFAHYDYWDDKVRRSILVDSGADLLIYGMGERPIVEIADAMNAGIPIRDIRNVRGTCYLAEEGSALPEGIVLDSYETVRQDKIAYCRAFMHEQEECDGLRGATLIQPHGKAFVVANPPQPPLSTEEMDATYALPYQRAPHPSYTEHIPAIDEVEFSITSCRGCFGACSFCALTYHQGRTIQVRSHASILQEAEAMTHSPHFKGYIHDVGGPTANFRQPSCRKQLTQGVCKRRQCLHPRCPNLEVSHKDYRILLKKLRQVPGVKKVFIRSGLRYDYIMYDKDPSFFRELVEHHVSGQLKVAPEHINGTVLNLMGKPSRQLYDRFVQRYKSLNEDLGKAQYIVPYFMSSHPGSDLHAAIELAQYLKASGQRPEQVQDFYPTPGTLSTTMFYTGLDPRTLQPVYVPRDPKEKQLQRALLQFYMPQNAALVRQALRQADREDLIGYGLDCLVRPEGSHLSRRPGAGARAQGRRSAGAPRQAAAPGPATSRQGGGPKPGKKAVKASPPSRAKRSEGRPSEALGHQLPGRSSTAQGRVERQGRGRQGPAGNTRGKPRSR